ITIVGMGTGFSYCSDGPTHHLIEDLAIMRAIPNIRITNVTDNIMARSLADMTCGGVEGTTYIRLDKDPHPDLYDPNTNFGEGVAKIRGGWRYVVSSGPMVHVVKSVIESMGADDVGLIDLYSLPVNVPEFLKHIKGAESLLTVEEHFLPGGLGSAVLETLNDEGLAIPVKRLGIDIGLGYRNCYKYGGRDVIRSHYGIDSRGIAEAITALRQK
ncbi:MAG: transketolase C-terminal domain-containing protein, partial [Solirubrobacterales bacterium]